MSRKLNIKEAAKAILYTPFSPLGIRCVVASLRMVGLLRRASERGFSSVDSIFVSSPYDRLGDHVFLLPFLEQLHATWPAARIHLAVGCGIAPLFAEIEYVEHVYQIPQTPRLGLFWWRVRELRALLRVAVQEISRQRYDMAIAPRWGADLFCQATRYLVYMTGANRRCAYSVQSDGGAASHDRLMTDIAPGGSREQEAVRYLRLLGRLRATEPGLPELSALARPSCVQETEIGKPNRTLKQIASRYDNAQVHALLQQHTGRVLQRYAIISPGTTLGSNSWPLEFYEQVLKELGRRYQLSVLIVGGSADAQYCDQLAATAPQQAVSLGGQTSLLELIAIIDKAELFLGNDSGPAHVAAGVGVPTVVISAYAKGSEIMDAFVRCQPSGPRVIVVQAEQSLAPCKLKCISQRTHCIAQISPEQVMTAVESLGVSASVSG